LIATSTLAGEASCVESSAHTGSSDSWATKLANASNNIVSKNSHPQPPGVNHAQTKLSSPSASIEILMRHGLFVVSPSKPEAIALFR